MAASGIIFFVSVVDSFLTQGHRETEHPRSSLPSPSYLLATAAKMCVAVHPIYSELLTFPFGVFPNCSISTMDKSQIGPSWYALLTLLTLPPICRLFAPTANTNKIRTIWLKRRPTLGTVLKARKGIPNFNFIWPDLNKIHYQNSAIFGRALGFWIQRCDELHFLLLHCQAVIQTNCSRIIRDCIWNAKQVKRIKQGGLLAR